MYTLRKGSKTMGLPYWNIYMSTKEMICYACSVVVWCSGYLYAVMQFIWKRKAEKKGKKYALVLAAWMELMAALILFDGRNPIQAAGTGMMVTICIGLFFSGRKKSNLVILFLFCIIAYGSYLIFQTLLVYGMPGQGVGFFWPYQTSLVLFGFPFLALEYVLIARYMGKVFRKKENIEISNIQMALFLMLPFSLLVVLAAVYLAGDVILMLYGYEMLVVITAVIAVFLIFVIYMFDAMAEQQRKTLDLKLYQQQGKLMMHQYRELEEKYQESRKVIHDIKNHLQMLNELYHAGHSKEAEQYSQDINGILRSLERVTYTENKMLNLILNEKLNRQELRKVKLKIEIQEADFSFMRDIDLTTLFTNLLDNAKEAIAQVEGEKILLLKIDTVNCFLVIRMENSYIKKEKEGHSGLGLKNVRKVVEAYGGVCSIQQKEVVFCVSITIPAENKRREKQ